MKTIVAILDTMWGCEGLAIQRAPRFFQINPFNRSGKRLYELVGTSGRLLVTNSCRQLVNDATSHGKPDPAWLRDNLAYLEERRHIDVLLVCGKVAQKTFRESKYKATSKVIKIPHPAARNWTKSKVRRIARKIYHGRLQKCTS